MTEQEAVYEAVGNAVDGLMANASFSLVLIADALEENARLIREAIAENNEEMPI